MRALRTSTALAAFLGLLLPAVAGAQDATVDQLLKFKPIMKGVDHETPVDAAAVAACKVEKALNAENRPVGWVLKDGQGKLLRKFVDTDKLPGLDRWSYYQDGFEVYRESDFDGDKRLDEVRWLNAGGTRIATVKGGKVAGWTRLSAEEASKVLVMALVDQDLDLLETVMATPEEMAGLGIPKAAADRAGEAAGQRAGQVEALRKKLVGWNAQTVWHRLDGMMPHMIPADAGLSADLVLYENAVVFAGPANGQGNPDKVAYLQVPEMVKVGDAWKFVALPNPIAPGEPVMIAANDAGIRASVYRDGVSAGPAANEAFEQALTALAKYDQDNQGLRDADAKAEVARYHHGRVPLLNAVVKAATTPDEQLAYKKQIADSLAEAYLAGYGKGLELLDLLVKEGGKIGSFAAFRKINAEFTRENEDPAANFVVVQKAWMGRLRDFLKDYPQSDEAPEALLQLAVNYEYNAEEDEARPFYEQLARDYSATRQGKKAAGALRRIDLNGKPLDLKGPGLKGGVVDLAQHRGKSVLVLFWASWAGPVKRDLPELTKLQGQFRDKGFEVVGVCLDNDKEEAEQFLKENPVAWAQIFEPNGMDGRLAEEFGIISLPTMFLVDAQGNVVSRNIRSSSELEGQLEKLLAGKAAGVALGQK